MKQKAFKDYVLNSERYTQIINTLLAAGFTHISLEIYAGSIEITNLAHTQEERLLGESILKGFKKEGEKVVLTESQSNGETIWMIGLLHPLN